MGRVPLGLTEALGTRTLADERPLLDSERAILEATYRPLAKRTAAGLVGLVLGILLLVLSYPSALALSFFLGFALIGAGFILMYANREFWALHPAVHTPIFRVYGADMRQARDGRITSQIIARPNGTPVFAHGRLANAQERESMGSKVLLAEYLPSEVRRELTLEERWELAHRIILFKSSFGVAALMLALTILVWEGFGEKFGLHRDWALLLSLTLLSLGAIRVAFRAARVVPRLHKDLAAGQVFVDPDGTQRLAASGTIWTDGGRQASWRRHAFSSKSPARLFDIGGMPPVSTVRKIDR